MMMVISTTKACRLLIFAIGALTSCFVIVQDQMEISRVSDYLQNGLNLQERHLLNGSIQATPRSGDDDSSISALLRPPIPYRQGGTPQDGNIGGSGQKATTLQLLLGDPFMMNRTIQAVALNPHYRGRLVVIVNVMLLNCTQRLPYIENTGSIVGIHIGSTLIYSQPTQNVWIKGFHTTIELNIPIAAYDTLKQKGNGVLVSVRDLVGNTDHTIPLLVDHSPKTFLSGLVWINKSRRFYEGRQQDIDKKRRRIKDFWKQNRAREDVGIRLGPVKRNDAYTLSHLLPWIQYHREQGVQHIYILDQENNLTQPNFPLTPPFLTYIRAPYGHMDYFVDQCDPKTHQVTSRTRHAVLQHILDTLVLRITPSDWMLISDLDEFFVPAVNQQTLPQQIRDFQHLDCQGLPWKPHYKNPMWEQWQDIHCHKTRKPVFELQYYQVKFSSNNTIKLSTDKEDYWALTKTIYQTKYVSRTRVHFGYPVHDSAISTKVLPHRGFLAHFRNGAPSAENLKKMHLHSPALRKFSREGRKQMGLEAKVTLGGDVGTKGSLYTKVAANQAAVAAANAAAGAPKATTASEVAAASKNTAADPALAAASLGGANAATSPRKLTSSRIRGEDNSRRGRGSSGIPTTGTVDESFSTHGKTRLGQEGDDEEDSTTSPAHHHHTHGRHHRDHQGTTTYVSPSVIGSNVDLGYTTVAGQQPIPDDNSRRTRPAMKSLATIDMRDMKRARAASSSAIAKQTQEEEEEEERAETDGGEQEEEEEEQPGLSGEEKQTLSREQQQQVAEGLTKLSYATLKRKEVDEEGKESIIGNALLEAFEAKKGSPKRP